MERPFRRRGRILPALLAYLAVGIGLFALKSAWAAIALYHAGIVIVVAMSPPGESIRPLFRGWRRGSILLGILAGAAGCLPLLALWSPLDLDRRAPEAIVRWGLTESWPAFLAYHILATPWLEEAFWRGALGSPSRLPQPVDLLFAGYHLLVLGPLLAPPWLAASLAALAAEFVALAAASWFWRQLRRRTGGLLAPVLSHLAADASILLTADRLMRN